MSDLLKVSSVISVLKDDASLPQKILLNQLLLLNPDSFSNGQKILYKSSSNSLEISDTNTVVLFSNNYPISITMTVSGGNTTTLTNVYNFSYTGDPISVSIQNDSDESDAVIDYVISDNSVIGSSYVYN